MGLQHQANGLIHRVGHCAAPRIPAESSLQRLPAQPQDRRRLQAERRQIGPDAVLRTSPVQENPLQGCSPHCSLCLEIGIAGLVIFSVALAHGDRITASEGRTRSR